MADGSGIKAIFADLGVPYRVTRHGRATRAILRVDIRAGAAIVVLPPGQRTRTAAALVREHADWLRDTVGELPQAVPFAVGSVIPVRGLPAVIRRDRTISGVKLRRGRRGRELAVGPGQDVESAVKAFLQADLLRSLTRLTGVKASAIGRSAASVGIADFRHWGICRCDGNITYNWRLALTPWHVRDYIVAHEVAHLAELNHGPRFWTLCESICARPSASGRRWLVDNETRLVRMGPA